MLSATDPLWKTVFMSGKQRERRTVTGEAAACVLLERRKKGETKTESCYIVGCCGVGGAEFCWEERGVCCWERIC